MKNSKLKIIAKIEEKAIEIVNIIIPDIKIDINSQSKNKNSAEMFFSVLLILYTIKRIYQ